MTDVTPATVLIVEDSPTQAARLEMILRRAGYAVRTAGDGRMGLMSARAALPDLIISDVLMPEMTGFEMCRALKSDEDTKSTPVILLTGLSNPMDIIAGLECGADNFITKPYEPAYLLDRVANLLSSTELRRASDAPPGLHVSFMGSRHTITSGREQILDLLISTFEQAVRLNLQLKARQDELERLNRELDLSSAHKTRFLARMSHELRTPLNVILGFAQLLRLEHASQEEYVDQILEAGRQLLELINEVLDVSTIEAGRLPVSLEPVHVRPALQRAVDSMRPIAAARHIRFEEVDAPPDLYARADSHRLNQVLNNLLSNAVKYNRQGGLIAVAGRALAGSKLRVSVRDTGPGIPASKRSNLFRPFERLGADASGIEGTGLGLALVKGIVEAMHGRIGVDSVPHRGSTFWFELERCQPPDPPPAASELAAGVPPGPHGRGTVLYIEDNRGNWQLIERVLRHRPAVRLLLAATGTEGIEMARTRTPDLILLDVHLPDVPGDEVVARLRTDPVTREIPVVIVSADLNADRLSDLRASGVAATLTKPIDVRQLLGLLDAMLART